MATKKKMLQAAAGNAGGAALDITDVFSTYLYAGTSAAQTITNGIDLAGEGGMIWGKIRSSADQHWIVDSERGTGSNSNYKYVMPNLATSELDFASRSVSSFNSNGFTLQNGTDKQFNESGQDYASWSFRKAPKFFDCVTYSGTGNGAADFQDISHNLGTAPGTVIIKKLNSAENWAVWHRSIPSDMLQLNVSDSSGDAGGRFTASGVANMTSTTFRVYGDNQTGTSGGTYVAYLFAHNNNDGEFGPDGSDIIKCGSYAGNSTAGHVINLGFEAQWVLVKRSDSNESWIIYDVIRGMPASGNGARIRANDNGIEESQPRIGANSQGFQLNSGDGECNINGGNYIYMAIRRGPLAQPESGTDVFAVDTGTGASDLPKYISNFPVDMAIITSIDAVEDRYNSSRLTGARYLQTNTTAAESGTNANFSLDYNDGWFEAGGTNRVSWMWKRAPGFFDVVAYSGNSVVGRTVSHNLTVAPEMIWVKNRDQSDKWVVYAGTDSGGTPKKMFLNLTNAWSDAGDFNNTEPTASSFTVASDHTVNNSGENYIAYLFATLPGVSKVGSFTGNGTSQDIDCGFTTAARFVLLKRTDSSGTWFILDTARGIVAGNDAILRPNTTTAEDNNYDIIDPLSSGFTINYVSAYNMNASGATYIFYAIA